jgi:hypothetical protein
MSKLRKGVVGTALLALSLGTVAVLTGPQAAPNPHQIRGKRVVLDCARGFRASAGGAYGGVSFNVFCENGRGHAILNGTVGTAYTIRMGVENDSIGADCFFTGDSPLVNESCVGNRITIR